MSIKFTMLAGGSLAAFAMLGTAGAAQAAVHHHKHNAVKKVAAESSEVTELKAEVESLTARVEAAEAAERITADQAATASAQAQTAQAQSAQVSAQVASNSAAVSGQIKSAINANAPSASSTTVSGQMFFDTSAISQKSFNAAGASTTAQPSGAGLDIKRLYIGVDHKFSNTFSATALIDASAGGAYSGNANLAGAQFYIKNAFVQAKLNDMLIVRVGAAPMPWFPNAEALYGERYVENTIADRLKLGNSADYGIHALGTLGDTKGLNVTYAVSVVDGGGYKNPTRSNTVDVEGRVAANYKGFTAAVGGYTGKLGADVQGVTYYGGLTAPRTATREDALLGYHGTVSGHEIRIGGEYFWAKNFSQAAVLGGSATTSTTYTSSTCTVLPCTPTITTGTATTIKTAASDVQSGWSLFGTAFVTPKWSVFGRYDSVKASQYLAPASKEAYYNMGLTYSPVKVVDLSLVYKHDVLDANGLASASLGTQNGKFAVSSSSPRITYDEIGLFGQFKF